MQNIFVRRRARVTAIALGAAAAAGLSLAPLAASNAATTHAAAASHTRHDGGLPVLTFKTNGKSITIGGNQGSGAHRVVFSVSHENQASVGFARLDPDVTLAQFYKVFNAMGPNGDPNQLYGIAQIATFTQANTGKSSVFSYLRPGTYVAVDLTQNMPATRPFFIYPSSHPAPLPVPGATVASREFGFTGATKLHDGEIVKWANNGFLVHMTFGIRAKSLAGADKIAALLKAGKDNAAQSLATAVYGWVGALSHGESFESVVTQSPGYWVIACFMDTQDGREHTTLGMEKVIQILK